MLGTGGRQWNLMRKIKALKDCGGWVKRGNGEGWFNHEILADALALITSQEQRIKELTEEVESLGAEKEHLDLVVEGKLKRTTALEKQVLNLTEENERLRAENAEQDEAILNALKEMGKIRQETKADTVKEFAERLIAEFRKDGRMNYYIRMTLDQIAKETMGEVK